MGQLGSLPELRAALAIKGYSRLQSRIESSVNVTHVVAKIEEKLECIYLKHSSLTIGDDSKESKTLLPELRSMNEAGASRPLHNRLQSDPRLSNC